MKIKEIDNSSIEDVVRIHEVAFKGFFLTALGPKFLSVYYKAVNNNCDGIIRGYYDRDKLIGYCSGSLKCRGFNTKIIKENFFRFCLIGIYLLFTRPAALLRLQRNLEKEGLNHNDDGDYAELTSIGVDPDRQGLGIGKKLLTALENDVRGKNVYKLSLTTDYYNNDKVVSFYKSLGYSIWYDFETYPHRRMYRMIKNL